MRANASGPTIYRMFALSLLLWVASLAASLLAALKWAGTDPLATSFPFHHANSLAGLLGNFAILTGLLGGGMVMTAFNEGGGVKSPAALKWAVNGWIALSVIAAAAGILHIGGSWGEIALSPIIVIAILIMLVIFVGLLLGARPDPTAAVLIIGVVFAALGLLLNLLPAGDIQLAVMQDTLGQGSLYFIGYPLAGIGLAFWLAGRFSRVSPEWIQQGVFSCGALAIFAGICLTAARLTTVVEGGIPQIVSMVGIVVIPLAYIIIAAHIYRTLSERNGTATLANHWTALAALCWLIGAVLSAILAIPGVSLYVTGTQLAQAQTALFGLGVLAIILGMVNQSGAELRGENTRITGLMPFWLVAFGGIGAVLLQAAAGVAQIFTTRVLGVGFLDTEAAIAPLYLLRAACLILLAAGALIYLAGFWIRRPYIHHDTEAASGMAGATNA